MSTAPEVRPITKFEFLVMWYGGNVDLPAIKKRMKYEMAVWRARDAQSGFGHSEEEYRLLYEDLAKDYLLGEYPLRPIPELLLV